MITLSLYALTGIAAVVVALIQSHFARAPKTFFSRGEDAAINAAGNRA